MATPVRRSRQRDRLLEILKEQRVHLTASELHAQLRNEFRTLSLGNVYRNLHILVDHGEVARLPLPTGTDVYEAVRDDHVHVICPTCGAIEDAELPEDLADPLTRWSQRVAGDTASSLRIELVRQCAACRGGSVAPL